MIGEHERMIGLIYEGVTDGAAWHSALTAVADIVAAVGIGLGMQDMQTHEFREFGSVGIDRNLQATYRRLAPGNKIWQEIGRRREPLTDQMVMPKAEFLRTELYGDWFRPQDFDSVMAHPAVFRQSASAVVVAFRDRSRGDFEADDLAGLGRFAAHFGRALSLRLDRERFAEQIATANLLLDEVEDAILLVERDLRLCHANAAARALLDAGRAIRSHDGRLGLPDPRAHAKLARTAAAGRSGEFHLLGPRPKGLIAQLHPCAGVFGVTGQARQDEDDRES